MKALGASQGPIIKGPAVLHVWKKRCSSLPRKRERTPKTSNYVPDCTFQAPS